MSRVERDPERGRAAAAKLKALGVKGILIKAAEQGYITQLACKMPECFCPEELGGACYFEPVTAELSDWMPTHEHFPLSKREGGLVAVDNAILAHRLCNRIDYSISVGRSYARDLERIRKAREEASRRNNVQIGNTEGGEIPTVVATADSESDAKKVYRKQEGLGQFPRNFFVEAIDESGEPVEEIEPEAEAATPKPKKTKKAPEWKSLPDAEKAQYLLDHQTLSDRTWTDELRLKGEKRDAFVRRILLGEVLPGEAVESDETETVEETETASGDLLKDRRSPADCWRKRNEPLHDARGRNASASDRGRLVGKASSGWFKQLAGYVRSIGLRLTSRTGMPKETVRTAAPRFPKTP